MQCGTCGTCGEVIHYRYPCQCKREKKNPAVIALVGDVSTGKRMRASQQMTLKGQLVMQVDEWHNSEWTDQECELVYQMQLRKIDLASEVVIIGKEEEDSSATHAFITYAKQVGKRVRRWEL